MQARGEVVGLPTEGAGEALVFDRFVEDEHERLFKALYFVTGNRQDAEDLTQEAFLKLWERWDQIDRIEDPTAYLFRIALNGFRMQRRRATMAARKILPIPSRSDAFEDVELHEDLRRLLLLLSPRQRAALLLLDLLEYPSEQAARILRVRSSTVRTLASQARRAIKLSEGSSDA
jgi:RNA polymerase sigma-70 factor (ECF subfamily)